MITVSVVLENGLTIPINLDAGATIVDLALKVDKVTGKDIVDTNTFTFLTPQTGLTFAGEIDLNRAFSSYLNYQLTGALVLTIKTGSAIGGFAEGIIIGDGTNTPTLTGIVEDVNSAGFVATNGIKNRFMCTKLQDAVYITYSQVL